MQAVVAADDAAVARVRVQREAVHDVHARGADGQVVAAACLDTQTELRAVVLAALSRFEAAAVEVAAAIVAVPPPPPAAAEEEDKMVAVVLI